jgi:hypothetical protein
MKLTLKLLETILLLTLEAPSARLIITSLSLTTRPLITLLSASIHIKNTTAITAGQRKLVRLRLLMLAFSSFGLSISSSGSNLAQGRLKQAV